MNWDAIGAMGEVLGAIAVLVTLVYLAVQIRQNNKLTITSIYESAMDGYIRLNQLAVENGELASIVRRGLADVSQLNDDETFRFYNYMRAYLNHLYKLFRLYERGAFPVKEWEITATEAAELIDSDWGREFRQSNHFFTDLYDELDRQEKVEFSDILMKR